MSSLELVHMNGRVYDPLIGRFLSPDIVIQAAGDLQNYNRYSYVLNNPLKYVDPSGNEIFSIIATIIAIGQKAWTTWKASSIFLLFFTAGFLDAYVESGDVGVSLKAGLISGTSAYFAHQIGTWFQDGWAANAFTSPTLANVVKATFHGVRGGIAAELSGGKFGAGAGAAFFGDYAGGLAHEYTGGGVGSGLIVSAIVGGTASEIGGGKFSNGALSGAMTFLLNTAAHSKATKGELEKYQSLAEELGWTGFKTELSEKQQLYYGKTASELLHLEGEGIDVSQQWEAVLREVPSVIVDSAGLVASDHAETARNVFLSGRYKVASASYGVVGVVITGYTVHGLHQAIGREGVGVSPRAMLDAIRNPLNVTKRSGGITQYKGRHAVVRLNAHGEVVTTWARGRSGYRIPRFGSTHRK